MKKKSFLFLPLMLLIGGLAVSCAPTEPSSSSQETSSSETSSSEQPSLPSEEPSVPSENDGTSSEQPSTPNAEYTIYFQDSEWWQNGGAGVGYLLTDDPNVTIDENNFGVAATHILTNDFLKCNYWSVDIAENAPQYIVFTRIGTAGGNQPVRYWTGKTQAIDLTTRGENDCYTIIDTLEDLVNPVAGVWKVYNPSEDLTEPPSSDPIDVYFKAPSSWGENINAYVWSTLYNGYTLAGWPGTAMESVSEGLYKFAYDVTIYNNIIFNDGTNQTPDLTSPTNPDMACYVYGKGWLETNTTEEPGAGDTPAASGWYIVGEGSFVKGSTWNVNGGIQMSVNSNYTGTGVEYMALDTAFSAGDVWKLCSTENEWISNGWETESGALFNGDMALIDDHYGGYNVGVNTTGLYDIYYKVYGDGTYSCWISKAKAGAVPPVVEPSEPSEPSLPSEEPSSEVPPTSSEEPSSEVPPTSSEESETNNKLYLIPNSNWKADNARFATYFFDSIGIIWVDMTDVDGDGIYECEIPEGYANVIFCRMTCDDPNNNWDNKWNQTEDLKVPTDGTNCYTVKEGTWDKGGGTWSTL